MLGWYVLWWKSWKKFVVVFFFLVALFWSSDISMAKKLDLPSNVRVVKNEKVMINNMMKGMKQHKTRFAYYYPGIHKDFRRYAKESKSYATFFDKLSKKDGYTAGIVSGYCIMIHGSKTRYVTFQFGYLTTARQERRINRRVKRIVSMIGKGSRVSKLKKAHDYLVRWMKYDTRYYSPYDAFFKGKGMCMSYALAYQRLLQEMKIPCIYVKGKNHAWNMVKIGRYWYNVDVTWDDRQRGLYCYFLKSDKDFPGHKRPRARWYSSLRVARRSYSLYGLP